MARAQEIADQALEKAYAGWFGGMNSMRSRWLLPDMQYVNGENIVNRGGIPRNRPGQRIRYTVPDGNFQGKKLYKPTKSTAKNVGIYHHVFAVDGFIYAIPVGTPRPGSTFAAWEPYRLKNLQFKSDQPFIAWETPEQEVVNTDGGALSIVPSYTLLMIQDGVSPAGFWDGEIDSHLDETQNQTPTGLWMKNAGGRLWVSRANTVVACDLLNPLSALERITGLGRGDFRFSDNVTGMAITADENRVANLLVYTNQDTSTLQSSILDREQWQSTPNFQNVLFPNIGCVSGRSPIAHANLLWWHAPYGLVNSNSAQASLLTSEIKYQDTEMAYVKQQLSSDLSGIATCSFGDFLLVSVPANDIYNRKTMALDYSVASEFNGQVNPAWAGSWTGTRPIEWTTAVINGVNRCFHASVDYFSLPGEDSTNHIWESFQNERYDSYEIKDQYNADKLIKQPLYCSFESKLCGEGMDLKKFQYAELDLIEISGELNLRISYAPARGSFHEVMRKKVIATVEQGDNPSAELAQILAATALRSQGRRVRTTDNGTIAGDCDEVESVYDSSIDKSFSLLVQWCGECGIESMRMFLGAYLESGTGSCEKDEEGIRLVTKNGTPFIL